MKFFYTVFLGIMVAGMCFGHAEVGNTVVLSNDLFRVEIERLGGQIIDVRLKDSEINPLSWRKTPETMPNGTHPGLSRRPPEQATHKLPRYSP